MGKPRFGPFVGLSLILHLAVVAVWQPHPTRVSPNPGRAQFLTVELLPASPAPSTSRNPAFEPGAITITAPPPAAATPAPVTPPKETSVPVPAPEPPQVPALPAKAPTPTPAPVPVPPVPEPPVPAPPEPAAPPVPDAPASASGTPGDAAVPPAPPTARPTSLDMQQRGMMAPMNRMMPKMAAAQAIDPKPVTMADLGVPNTVVGVFFRIKVDYTGRVVGIAYLQSGGDPFKDALLAQQILKNTYIINPPLAKGETALIELDIPYPEEANRAAPPDLSSLLP